MKQPAPQEMLLARANEFTISIKLLLDKQHSLPALVILYTAIDILGSLLRQESEPNTTGGYFKKWVDAYMIGNSQSKFSAEDLWGARCGLLHTHVASSKLSRQGSARQIHYFRGPLPIQMKEAMIVVEKKGKKIFVDIDSLSEAFEQGIRRFFGKIQSDSRLEKRVLYHSADLFGTWTHKM